MENPSLTGWSERRSGAFLGPAVSPRGPAFRPRAARAAVLLPPFVRPGLRPAVPTEEALPLVGLAPEEAVSAVREAEPLLREEELPFLEAREGEEAPRALDALEALEEAGAGETPETPEPPAPEVPDLSRIPELAGGTAVASSTPREAVATPVEHPEPVLPPVVEMGEGAAMEEIAGRLERIALALREGRPIELFAAGASDPLEVLIAGYALGYSEAFRRQAEERRQGR